MKLIQLADIPSQTVRCLLGSQDCRIDVKVRDTGTYLDLFVSDADVVRGVACRNRVLLVRDAYLGFTGDLVFVDQTGDEDPTTPGMGSRFQLFYLEPTDYL